MLGLDLSEANGLSLDETSAQGLSSDKTLARFPSQPSGSHCGDGFLHRTNDHFRLSLLACRLADYADFG